MPKFYKQNKKRVDPRYFMDEKLEAATDWPEDKTSDAMQGSARRLAQKGLQNQISGERPPWEGDGATDVHLDLLSTEDLAALRSIRDHLLRSKHSGAGDRGDQFGEIMKKLGISLEEANPGY